MITKLAKATGKKLIVVRATHGAYGADSLINPPENKKLDYVAWSSTLSRVNNSFAVGQNASLAAIAKRQFAGVANDWDYIILQNNTTVANTASSDINMYNYLVNNGVKFKKFMLNATHYSTGLGSDRKQEHLKAANTLNNKLKKAGKTQIVTVIKSGNIIGKYGSNWANELTFDDSAHHMGGKAAYLYALTTYAKIYGVSEFAKSTKDSNYIKLYSNGTTKDFAPDKYNTSKCNKKISRCKVTQETAKKLQSIVRNYYE